MQVYFRDEQEVRSFVAEATKLKLQQKEDAGLNLKDLDEIAQDYGENHPVLPSKR